MATAIGLRWPPDDDNTHGDSGAQISLQSGQNGADAARFTAEMLRMYAGYAERHSWPVSVDTLRASADGRMLSLTLRIASFGAYGWLKYEHGTHRVQRVPIDGSEGRIHTHTVKVIVRPLPLLPDSELLLAGFSGEDSHISFSTRSCNRPSHRPEPSWSTRDPLWRPRRHHHRVARLTRLA